MSGSRSWGASALGGSADSHAPDVVTNMTALPHHAAGSPTHCRTLTALACAVRGFPSSARCVFSPRYLRLALPLGEWRMGRSTRSTRSVRAKLKVKIYLCRPCLLVSLSPCLPLVPLVSSYSISSLPDCNHHYAICLLAFGNIKF
jgi:hypothetical protein